MRDERGRFVPDGAGATNAEHLMASARLRAFASRICWMPPPNPALYLGVARIQKRSPLYLPSVKLHGQR